MTTAMAWACLLCILVAGVSQPFPLFLLFQKSHHSGGPAGLACHVLPQCVCFMVWPFHKRHTIDGQWSCTVHIAIGMQLHLIANFDAQGLWPITLDVYNVMNNMNNKAMHGPYTGVG